MTIVYSTIAVILMAALILRMIWSVQFSNQVKQLFDDAATSSKKAFAYTDIVALPEPVQRYFKHVLQPGQASVSYARIKHGGLFKTGLDKKWVRINGEQYATTSTPGFIWKGRTLLFTARDMYISGKGRLIVCLLSILKFVDVKGDSYNQGELLRWLGESVLYPTNLLPDERIQWIAIDNNSSKMIFNYNGISLHFILTFNGNGEIIQLKTERYMDSARLETWIIGAANYKCFDNILVPTRFDVSWRLKAGDLCYAKFHITAIEYGVPNAF